MLPQRRPQDKMQSIVHPTKAFTVPQEFHQQGSCSENDHARNKFGFRNEMIQPREKEPKWCMQYLAT